MYSAVVALPWYQLGIGGGHQEVRFHLAQHGLGQDLHRVTDSLLVTRSLPHAQEVKLVNVDNTTSYFRL